MKQEKFAQIAAELKKRNAVLVAHYYCDPEVQELAELTGVVFDSWKWHALVVIILQQLDVGGRRKVMGETSKILSQKNSVDANFETTCSLDLGCPVDEFSAFCDQHPDHTVVVVYANTSAAVKHVPIGW